MRGAGERRPTTAKTWRTGGAARRIAILGVILLGLTTAVPTEQVVPAPPPGGGWPLPSIGHWFQLPRDWSKAFLGLPAQSVGGSAADASPYVSADATRAGGGSGGKPGRGVGALEPYQPYQPEVRQQTTPARAGSHSFDPATSKRLPERAAATSDVYANADGSYTRRTYQDPVNYKAADGTWRPIDRTLVPSADGRLRQKANATKLSVAASAADPALVTFNLAPGAVFSYSLRDARDVAATVSADTATYVEALPEVDVRLRATAAGVKEYLVLKSPEAGNVFEFPLRLQGLTPRLEKDGSVSLRDGKGETLGRIPAGYMQDSRADGEGPAESAGVRYELINVGDQQTLRVVVNDEWLNSADRVYPVTVDPTTEQALLSTNVDTYVHDDSTSNKDTREDLRIGTWNDGEDRYRSFLKFTDFEQHFGGAQIVAADLYLWNFFARECSSDFWFSVHRLIAGWNTGTIQYPGEDGFTPVEIGAWEEPAGTSACTNSSDNLTGGNWLKVQLDHEHINDWASGWINNGLAVIAPESHSGHYKKFTSRNGPSDQVPFLQLTYEPNLPPQILGQHPESGHPANSLTPQLQAEANDPNNAFLDYNFLVFDSAGDKIAESGWLSTYFEEVNTWTIPTGLLRWGEDYKWTVMVNDGYLTSASQAIHLLSTRVPQPGAVAGLTQNGSNGFDPGAGNYTTAATDATVASVGPPLSVQRRYNSSDPRLDNVFGAGWSSVADMRTTEWSTTGAAQPNVVTVRYPDGREATFGKNHDGTFEPPPGRFSTLTARTGGGYQLVDKDATTYIFSSAAGAGQWRIGAITDSDGRTETFTYSNGRLATITAASGRSLHLNWVTPADAAHPHVSTVSTDEAVPGDPSTKQTWSYSYQADHLTSVCPSTSATACTTYNLTEVTRHPATVLGLGPRSYWRLNETDGTAATSAVLANMGTDNGLYHNVTLGRPGPLTGSTATAAGFDGSSSRVQLPPEMVSPSNRRSIGLWFRTTESGVLVGQSKDALGTAPTTKGYTPLLYVGEDGTLKGQFATLPKPGTDLGSLGTLQGAGSGRCMSPATFPGGHIEIRDCDGGNLQLWQLTGSSGQLFVGPAGDIMCLAVEADRADNFAEAETAWCDGTAEDQRWRFNRDGAIVGMESGLCLDTVNAGTANGTKVQLRDCLPLANRRSWFSSVHTPISSSTTVTDGQWHHAAIVADGTTQTLYLDGAPVGTLEGDIATFQQRYTYLGGGFLGGGWPSQPHHTLDANTGHPSYFTGDIAEVVAFDRPLRDNEVHDLVDSRAAAKVLSSVVRPSGGTSAEVSYDTQTGTVSEVTDHNGGLWKIARPTVAGSSQVYVSAVLGAAPADYWRLAETGATEAVNRVNGNIATYNAVTLGTPGGPFEDSTVASFDGSTSYLRLPNEDLPGSGPTSVSMWFQVPEGNTDGGVLFGYQEQPVEASPPAGDRVPALYVGTDGKVRGHYSLNGAAQVMASDGAVNDGQWHHVALTTSGTSQALYLDGVRVGEVAAAVQSTDAQYVYVGAGTWSGWPGASSTPAGFFSGAIAEVAYYPRSFMAGVGCTAPWAIDR